MGGSSCAIVQRTDQGLAPPERRKRRDRLSVRIRVLLQPVGPDGRSHRGRACTTGARTALYRKDGKPAWTSKVPEPTGCGKPWVSGNYAYSDRRDERPARRQREHLPWQLINAPREQGKGWAIYALNLKTGDALAGSSPAGATSAATRALAYGACMRTAATARVCFPRRDGEPVLPDAKDGPRRPGEEVRRLLARDLL